MICLNYDGNIPVKQYCEDNKIIFFPLQVSTFNEKNENLVALFSLFVMKKNRKVIKKPVDNDNFGYNKVYKTNEEKKKQRKYSLI
jgi:hypothetical protein